MFQINIIKYFFAQKKIEIKNSTRTGQQKKKLRKNIFFKKILSLGEKKVYILQITQKG